MKRLAFIAGLLLLVAAVTSGSARAYYLDAPHNESNGFTCRTCHSSSYAAGSKLYGYTGSGIDDTARNALCLVCHDGTNDGGLGEVAAPSKVLHSSAAMGTASHATTAWTTQCTDCHDPHYQAQLDWAAADGGKLWLATGTVNGAPTPVAAPTGGPAGSTIISYTSIAGQNIGGIDWSQFSNWTNKGGLVDPLRATDGTRGLILVPDTSSSKDSFEIIAADATTITVKGQMSATSGATFGIMYGDNIRSTVKNAETYSGAGSMARTVKFFVPNVIANDYGGFVDERAVNTPVGLCQVCHPPYVAGVSPTDNHWNTNNSGDKHNATARCTQCHNPLAAFAGGADHTAKIVVYTGSVTPSGGGTAVAVNCDDCHSDVSAAPDSAHLNRGAVNASAGSTAPISDGTGCGACHDTATSSLNGNIAITRLGLADANFGTGTYPVDCSACHPNNPQAVADGTHGGHSSSAFGWDSNCATCHPDNGGGVVKDVHNNNCLNCHDNSSGGTGTTILGSSANGVDGDARTSTNGGPVTSGSTHSETCTSCHGIGTTNSIPDAHHLASTNNYAQNGVCTQCHDSSTAKATATNGAGNPADHSGLIADYTNCTNCHSANVGTSQGAVIDSSTNKVHDSCVACHNTDSSLKTLSQVDTTRVVAMPNPGSASNDGGGTCAACHGEYFPNHQNIDHATSLVTKSANCANCHNAAPTGAARAAATSPFTGTGEVHATNTCSTYHQATGVLVAATSLAPGIAAGGGTCETCHLGGALPNTWQSIHTAAPGVSHGTKVTLAANCDGCHTTITPGASAAARDALTAPFVGTGEVHNTSNCATCHDTTTGLTKAASGLAVAISQGDCETCHISTSQTWTGIHSSAAGVSHSSRVDLVAPCSNCHGNNIAGSGARDAITAPFTGSGEVHSGSGCATCHNTTDGSTLTSGYTKADTIAAGDCSTCHTQTSTWQSIHDGASGVDHSTRVYNNSLCGSCHDTTAGGNAPDAITPPYVGSGEAHATNRCDSCHNANGGTLTVAAPGGSGNIAAGDCQSCHDQYFGAHQHDHSASVIVTSSCASCHAADTASRPATSQALLASTAPFVAAGEVHSASSCATCHNTTTDGSLRAGTVGDATVSAGADGKWECAECHASQWDSLHGGVATTVHDISATSSCANCHGNAVAGSNARDAVTAPYVASGEVHNDGAGTTCATCHNVTTGARITGANGKGDATVSDGGDGTWVCAECHTATWYVLHMNSASDGAASGVDHSGRVDIYSDGTYGSCANCHTGTAGGASGLMPVNSGDDKVHDACTVCHASDGTVSGTTTYGGKTLAAGNCSTCHGAYFDSHVHGQDGGYVDHDVVFNASVDISQTGGASNSCYNCHDDAGLGKGSGALGTWAAIKTEHATVGGTAQASACATCHDYATNGNQSGDADTPLLATVQTVISSGTGNTCISCHVPKSYADSPSTSQHGGHSAADFGSDAQCTTCHNDGGKGVVEGIHNNNCLTCHTSASGGLTTVRFDGGNAGVDSTNGVDADPSLAISSGAHKSTTCLGCHNISSGNVDATSVGGIHHNSATYGVLSTSTPSATCGNCHTAVDHTAMIKDTPGDCNSCHTNTAASAGVNPPISGTLGDPKVHDDCTTCHAFAGSGWNGQLISLPSPRGLVYAMPDGGTIGGTDGGGDCANCHDATAKKSLHHGSSLATGGQCQVCHVNSDTSGVNSATAPPQLACQTCHVDNSNGLDIISLRLSKLSGSRPNHLENKNANLGNATTDGNGFVSTHSFTAASITVQDYRACFSCHNGSYPNAPVVVPFHGFPGDQANNDIMASNANMHTNIDGSKLLVDESSGDNIPRYSMYYHPGHINFRRFNTKTNGTKLYDRGGKNGIGGYNERGYEDGKYFTTGMSSTTNSAANAILQDIQESKKTVPDDLGNNIDFGNIFGKNSSQFGQTKSTKGYSLTFNAKFTNFSTPSASSGIGYGELNNIPYFTALAPPNDRVFVNSAEVNTSGNLVVIAGNDEGCNKLTVKESGGSTYGSMTLNATTGYCELTTAVSAVPAAVDVSSSGTGTPSVTNYPVTDNSVQPGTITLSASTYSVNENGGSVTITVNRTGGSGAVTVDYATSNGSATAGSDYTAASGTLSWADGDTAAKTFTVSIINDTLQEGDETVNIALSNATGGASLGTPGSAVLTIVDDDQPGTLSFELGSYSVSEGGGSITINVTRTAGSVGAVDVSYATSDGSATTAGNDYTATSGTLSWIDGDTASKSFTVTILQDTVVEGDETVNLTLSSATGGASIGGTNPVTLTIVDDDNSPPAFGSPTYTASPNATEGSAYTTTTMVGAATDPEGDAITYGDAGTGSCTWTSVATDGTITGTAPSGSGGTSCTVDVTATATGGSDTATLTINIDAAPTAMSGDGGQTVDGIFPGDNFTSSDTNVSVTVTFTTANAGDKNNYWTLYDEAQNGSTLCAGTFSSGDGGNTWTASVDFSQCGGYTGVAFMEYGIEDNTTGDKFKIKYLPITLGSTSEYLKTFSDSGYSNETTSFNSNDMVYVEVNSAAVHNILNGTCDGTQAAKLAGFDDTKYIDKLDFSSCSYEGGNVYRWSFDLSQQSITFPTGTYWYQGEMKPADSSGNSNIKVGLVIQVTK